jgi:spore germination protein GerM
VETALLERLTAGPTDADRARGLDTALGQGARLQLRGIDEGVVSLELTPGAPPPAAERLPLAVAQVVLTATSVAGVDSVVLLRDGVPVGVPLPGGEQVSGPVSGEQYMTLLGPQTAVTKAAPTPSAQGSPTRTGPPSATSRP